MLCVTCNEDVPVVFNKEHDCISASCPSCGTYRIENPTDQQIVEAFKDVCSQTLEELFPLSVASVARYRFITEALELDEPLELQDMFGTTLHFYSQRVGEAMEMVTDSSQVTEVSIMLNALSRTLDEMINDQQMIVKGIAKITGKTPPALCFIDGE